MRSEDNEDNMKKTALIMAGGKGERFWPKSRLSLPKQFLSLTDDGKTMIQLTVERISPLVDAEDIFIVTNENYKDLVKEQLPQVPSENIICEPVGRNTAPCIGLGAMHMLKKYGEEEDPAMIVLPSDHLIKNDQIFTEALTNACMVAEEGENLVTIGITPNYPETGYGYIRCSGKEADHSSFAVEAFVEKPDLETAQSYLRDGHYLWNSGMFVWKLSTILNSIKNFLPDTFDKLSTIGNALGSGSECTVLKEVFPAIDSESVDYGIMERADNIYIIPGNFGWDDVGSWLAVSRINNTDSDNNCLKGNVVAYNTSNCTIESTSAQLVATVGLKDTIVVSTEDAVLIASKENAGQIKEMLAQLKEKGKSQYL